MNNHLFLLGFSLLTAAMVTSCYSAADDELQSAPAPVTSRDITFTLSTFDLNQQPMGQTRADGGATITATPTRLFVLDVVDGQVKQSVERTTEEIPEGSSSALMHVDNVLANLSLALAYGTHDLYFVAAVNPYVSHAYSEYIKSVTWNTNSRLSITWARHFQITVDQASENTSEVSLPLVVGEVLLTCSDAIDNNTEKMQISGSFRWTLDLSTMKGIIPENNFTYTETPTSHSSGQQFAIYSFAPSSGTTIGNITFSALKSDNSAITSHTLSDVPLSVGYISSYTGYFFSRKPSFTLTTTSQWSGVNSYTY